MGWGTGMVEALARRSLVPLALIGMLSASALILSRIYAGDLASRLLVGAAVAVVGVSVAVSRLPAWCVAPISVGCLTGYTAVVVWCSAAASNVSGGLVDLSVDALRNGLPRLLTAMIPIEPQPDTLVLPVVALWIAGLATSELALRGRRVLISYIPIVFFLGLCLYLVGPNATPSTSLALVFSGCAAVGLAASTDSNGAALRDLGRRELVVVRLRVAGGTAFGLVLIVLASTVFGPLVAGRVGTSPTDPRAYVTPPQLDSLDESPLARLSGWALDPTQHLFDIEMSGESQRVRLAVMSDYDGVTWRVNGNYQTAGRVLTGPPSEADQSVSSEDTIEQTITIDQLDGKLVPAVTVPEQIEGVRVAYDSSIATIALPDGLYSGLTYTVVSRPTDVNINTLPDATVPTDDATVSQYATLQGEVPSDIQQLASRLAEGIDSPYLRALAVESFISEHYEQVADAPSGHAYPNLSFFLFGDKAAGGQKGTSEQFAAAFAVLARALGLPTRVAVGFDVVDGQSSVTGASALAWPEVLFEGLGWVAFDPLPRPDTEPQSVEDFIQPTPEPSPSTPTAVDTPSSSTLPASPAAEAAEVPQGTADNGGPTAAIATGVAAAALLCLYALVPLGIRRQRRRRLWGDDPPGRVLGAWREVHDALRLAGTPVPASLSATEVSAFAENSLDGACLVDLAALVNQVTFAPDAVTDDQADRAVSLAVGFLDGLRSRRSRWKRLLWSLDPRPLWWARSAERPASAPGR